MTINQQIWHENIGQPTILIFIKIKFNNDEWSEIDIIRRRILIIREIIWTIIIKGIKQDMT